MTKPELHFVPVRGPGHVENPEEAWAMRSHVRRTISWTKKNRSIHENLILVTHPHHKKRGRPLGSIARSPRLRSSKPALPSRGKGLPTNSEYPDRFRNEPPLHRQQPRYESSVQLNSNFVRSCIEFLPKSPTPAHPYAIMVAPHVQMPLSRLDYLFKSEAFRISAEPTFDTSHIDGSMSLQAMFPESMNEPAFLYAVVYAIAQALDYDQSTVETLQLKCKAIEKLNQKLTSESENPSTPAVAATIMVLKSVAYKKGDRSTYELHSRGLSMSLQALAAKKIKMTWGATRALFWLDLFGSALTSAPRQLSHSVLPDDLTWHRTIASGRQAPNLPLGFVRHHNLLPEDLLDCVIDMLELQSCLRTCSEGLDKKYALIEPMQASIESRLAFQARDCMRFGIVAEAARLGLFMLAYQTWIEIWERALVPSRLAEQLVNILLEDLCVIRNNQASGVSAFSGSENKPSVWNSCRDLQLWLLFVGTFTAKLDGGYIRGLRMKYKQALVHFEDLITNDKNVSPDPHLSGTVGEVQQDTTKHQLWMRVVDSVLKDFIYCDGWRERRFGVPEWCELEQMVNNLPLSDRGIPTEDIEANQHTDSTLCETTDLHVSSSPT